MVQVREKVTSFTLTKETQKYGEDIIDYVKRFQDRAVDCTESINESQLVEICIGGMLPDFEVHLINLKLGTFSALLESSYNL